MNVFNKKKIEEILTKPYLTYKDIAVLAGCSEHTAKKHKVKIRNKVLASGRQVIDSRYVSVSDTLAYLGNPYYYELYEKIHKEVL